MTEIKAIKAPVQEGSADNVEICRQYYMRIVYKENRDGNIKALREMGACYELDKDCWSLAVDPETGNTGAETANQTQASDFLCYVNIMRGVNYEVTPAQALTSQILEPLWMQIPPEFNRLKIISFPAEKSIPIKNLTVIRELRRAY